MKTIIITGTPGTGKTIIAKKLAKKINYEYIDVNEIIKKNKLNNKYLKKFDTYEVDEKKLNTLLIKIIKNSKNNLVIDSHLSHYLNKKYVDLCIVTKCNIKELKKRLNKRKYSKIKIRENLDAEIFDVCLVEAKENKHKILIVDTTKKKVDECLREIIKKS
ncbi:MAG: adenylate kinase family protein [Nanoarchaeota archaeon]